MTTGAFTVGVIGHRYLGDESCALFARTCCHALLSDLRQKFSRIKAISALSDGADSIFAQTAISLGMELESIIPFANFNSDFPDELPRERLRNFRLNAATETQVNFKERSQFAYRKSMQWLIFKSNLIVAMWDGVETGPAGGTWESVKLCQKLDKPVVRIDTRTRALYVITNGNHKMLTGKRANARHVISSIGL